jgi:hypothetical protein
MGVAIDATKQPLGSGIQLHKAGLLFTAKHNISTWEKVGADLLSFANSSTWWIADWLVYGEIMFQDRYKEAIQRTTLSYQTLRNYTWVARKFPLSRRRQTLSFSHHLEVVALDQPQQDYWLRQAEKQHWSRNRLRTEVRDSLLTQQSAAVQPNTESRVEVVYAAPADELPSSSPVCDSVAPVNATPLLHLRLSAEDLANLERAASKECTQVETWATRMLLLAAAEE